MSQISQAERDAQVEEVFGPSDGVDYATNLMPQEEWWRDKYDWLLASGYQLRPRFSPNWVPKGSEDAMFLARAIINDATRVSDKTQVVLKRVKKSEFPHEVDIMRILSEESTASDPQNHSVPLLEILDIPSEDTEILVLPLARKYDDPVFDTNGEALDFIRQVLEGFHFLHKNRVAHRDVASSNIMMDARQLYPSGFHPVKHDWNTEYTKRISPSHTRTQNPPKYWIIDFGYSRHYDEAAMPPSEVPFKAIQSSVPEFNNGATSYNPFPTDVYNLGELFKQQFLDGMNSTFEEGEGDFEFLRPLLEDMMAEDPAKRPDMEAVLSRFEELCSEVSTKTLRSRYLPRSTRGHYYDDSLFITAIKVVPFWLRRLKYTVKGTPPMPKRP